MTYPELNSTLVGENLMETFVYANLVTNNFFGLFITIAFFLVVFIGSTMVTMKYGRDIQIKNSLLASSFATLGWATILEMYSGILSPVYFFVLIMLSILSFIWVALGE